MIAAFKRQFTAFEKLRPPAYTSGRIIGSILTECGSGARLVFTVTFSAFGRDNSKVLA